ncbi:MAG TPA: hypothetical protein VE732_03110 [Nitrososphaera sp.]|nr:hypothetical protein [Nitrososphaera sp.]
MTKIRLNKGIAKNDIRDQVDRGQEFVEQFADAGPINSHGAFLKAQKDVDDWSANNSDLLHRIFDDDSIMKEYESLNVPAADEDQSRLEQIRTIRASLIQRIEWLNALVNRIDDIPQSERTPTASWGRRN